MLGSKAVKERIEELIAQAPQVSKENDTPRHMGWLTAAQYAVNLVCPSSSNPYNQQAAKLIEEAYGWVVTSNYVPKMAGLLGRLLEEIEGGLLQRPEDHRHEADDGFGRECSAGVCGLLERIERAGADIAVDDAECCESRGGGQLPGF